MLLGGLGFTVKCDVFGDRGSRVEHEVAVGKEERCFWSI